MEYNGYVYIWYDTAAKFFYIGGHWGLVEDRYICSNAPMLRAYKLRPHTFRFKVLQYVNGSKVDLREAEQNWLNLIRDNELMTSNNVKSGTCRYYNVKKHAAGGNGSANKGNSNIGGWNRGYSSEEILMRRRKLYSFIPLDRPSIKKPKTSKILKPKIHKPKKMYSYTCFWCSCSFFHERKNRTFCSISCRNSYAATKVKQNGAKTLTVRKKLSQIASNRKISVDQNGKRFWSVTDSVSRLVTHPSSSSS